MAILTDAERRNQVFTTIKLSLTDTYHAII
jgi:hypothetical protein